MERRFSFFLHLCLSSILSFFWQISQELTPQQPHVCLKLCSHQCSSVTSSMFRSSYSIPFVSEEIYIHVIYKLTIVHSHRMALEGKVIHCLLARLHNDAKKIKGEEAVNVTMPISIEDKYILHKNPRCLRTAKIMEALKAEFFAMN
ncbi:unnamed protein product [Protopolystoma xenopodis]|uniref:Uncharacterized protein n=1 Tax=Protopolystoma xenopodis TaxID=117903 RepID=A0A3S5BW42_9PLAT|nr:unnamed protein product [Protopolystoma xenopodis]